jgi:hypothetical protein
MPDRVQQLVETVLKRHLSNITTLVVMEWSGRVLRDPKQVEPNELVAFLASVRCSAGFFLNERALDVLWRDMEALDLEERERKPTQPLRIAWRDK